MSELTRLLVLAVAFAAFILAAYMQEGWVLARSTQLAQIASPKGRHGGNAGKRLRL